MYHAPSMLVGSEWRGAIGGRTLPVVNPCTEEVLGETPAADERDVAEALEHARAALKSWSAVHGWDRAKVLRNIARRMEARRDELAHALSLEIGRPLSQSAGEANIAHTGDGRVRSEQHAPG